MKTKMNISAIRRVFEKSLSMIILIMGVLFFILVLPSFPSMIYDAISGNSDSIRSLINSLGAIGICWAQWEWRNYVFPQLRKDRK